MRSYGQLWDVITGEENLRAAWRRVRRGHARSLAVGEYASKLDGNLRDLRRELMAGSYEPGDYRQFPVNDPKPRTISCAPVRDRVVHHAVCGVITPCLERSFIENTFACRVGKGMHAACRLARECAGRYPYFCKMDIRHYFDSVDHARLIGLLAEKFRERELRRLLERIILHPVPGQEAGRGIPIGNLTSQWFANFYLDEYDHLADGGFGAGRRSSYMRYMDDLLFFADTKANAWRLCDETREWLWRERGLRLKEGATVVAPVGEGVPFLGLRIHPGCWRFKRERFLRARRTTAKRARQFNRGEIGEADLAAALGACEASCRAYGFKNILMKATGEGAAAGSNRVKRGGSWNNDARNCRSAYRNNNAPTTANNNNGFRLSSTCRCVTASRQSPLPLGPRSADAETNMRAAPGQVGVPPKATAAALSSVRGAAKAGNAADFQASEQVKE